MTEQAPASSVQHLGFAWFAMVMGLCGLSLAWSRAVPHSGSVALLVSQVVGVLAAVVLVLLLLGQLWRLVRHPAALLVDARHPIRHVFVAALPSSLVLLPTVWVVHQGYSLWADVMWMLGAVGLVLATLGVVGRCLQQPFGIPFWGMSFPLAASAALGLHLSPEPGLAQWLAGVWLWVVTGVIGTLLLATLRGLMRGQLLQPEGPATLPKAGADPSQRSGG